MYQPFNLITELFDLDDHKYHLVGGEVSWIFLRDIIEVNIINTSIFILVDKNSGLSKIFKPQDMEFFHSLTTEVVVANIGGHVIAIWDADSWLGVVFYRVDDPVDCMGIDKPTLDNLHAGFNTILHSPHMREADECLLSLPYLRELARRANC